MARAIIGGMVLSVATSIFAVPVLWFGAPPARGSAGGRVMARLPSPTRTSSWLCVWCSRSSA
jgi:hypothetical protein